MNEKFNSLWRTNERENERTNFKSIIVSLSPPTVASATNSARSGIGLSFVNLIFIIFLLSRSFVRSFKMYSGLHIYLSGFGLKEQASELTICYKMILNGFNYKKTWPQRARESNDFVLQNGNRGAVGWERDRSQKQVASAVLSKEMQIDANSFGWHLASSDTKDCKLF